MSNLSLFSGFHNNNFNDRQGGFNDRDSGPNQRGRGRNNWRDEEREGRNFPQRGGSNFGDRKSSRWMGNQRSDDWDDEDQPKQPSQQDSNDQSSRNEEENFNDNDNGNGGTDGDNDDYQQPEKHEDAPPGTEDPSFDDGPSNEPSNEPQQESFNQNEPNVDQSCGDDDDDNAGNTTPLCDETESKE